MQKKVLLRVMERLWSDAEQEYRRRLLALLPRDSDLRLLDLGCDDGSWTETVRLTLGVPTSQVRGLEIDEERAELARSHGFDVQIADLDDIWPFEDDSVSIVHANQVIEHVKRLDHFVSEIRRVLVRGGLAVVCTENLASWHNVAALILGYQPFSSTNISEIRPIGNPFALHAGSPTDRAESWQHVHVMTLEALRDIFTAHGYVIEQSWGVGYHPLFGRFGRLFASVDPRHSHFIGLVARTA